MAPSKPPEPGTASAVPSRLQVLRRRSDFLAAARAARAPGRCVVVQARDRGDTDPPRVGFTCSRKVGNAVTRNRAKRRLRAAAREILACHGRPGWDYVLIGRAGTTATCPYSELTEELRAALARLHRDGPAR